MRQRVRIGSSMNLMAEGAGGLSLLRQLSGRVWRASNAQVGLLQEQLGCKSLKSLLDGARAASSEAQPSNSRGMSSALHPSTSGGAAHRQWGACMQAALTRQR